MATFEGVEQETTATAQTNPITPSVPQPNWRALLLQVCALVLWLIAGGFLTWLVAGFNRVLAPDRSPVSPSVIASMFLASTVLVGWFQWRAWRGPSMNLRSQADLSLGRNEALERPQLAYIGSK